MIRPHHRLEHEVQHNAHEDGRERVPPDVDLVLEPIASSYAVLTDDEKELGSCIVDIGGGTTDIAVFTDGAIRHTAVIPIAGDQVTNDIAMALRTPTQNAEEIKIKYACALTQLARPDETIKVPGVGDKPAKELSRQALAEVVIEGIKTNVPLHQEIFQHAAFQAGGTDIHYLEKRLGL